MEIKTFRKLKDNKYKIIFDNEETVTLYDDLIIEYNLLVNKKLNNKELQEIVNKNDTYTAYYKALKQLERKMRSKKEIESYLRRCKYEKDTIDSVIKKLYNDGYLNDTKYIKAYINDQVNLTDKGPIKIKKELEYMGFKDELVNKGIAKIKDDVWTLKIDKFITKRLKMTTNLSASLLKQKVIYELINKGHYKDLISSLINNYEFKNSKEALEKEYYKIKSRLEKKFEGNELKFYLKAKLLNKGFTSEEILSIMDV